MYRQNKGVRNRISIERVTIPDTNSNLDIPTAAARFTILIQRNKVQMDIPSVYCFQILNGASILNLNGVNIRVNDGRFR